MMSEECLAKALNACSKMPSAHRLF